MGSAYSGVVVGIRALSVDLTSRSAHSFVRSQTITNQRRKCSDHWGCSDPNGPLSFEFVYKDAVYIRETHSCYEDHCNASARSSPSSALLSVVLLSSAVALSVLPDYSYV